jgi:hypothetical protein
VTISVLEEPCEICGRTEPPDGILDVLQHESSIPSPATGYNVLTSFILRTLPVLYSELPQNLGKTFKLTYAKLLKCLVWLAKG